MLPDKPSQDEQLTLQDHLSFLAEIANNSTLDPREMHEGGSFPISQQLVLTHDLYHSVVEVFRDVPLPTACYGSLPAWEMGRKRRPSQVHIEKSCSLSRPLVSYVDMIKEALTEKPDHRMKLQEIYAWIKEKYPFFKTSTLAWKNSVRHALSVSNEFRRITIKPSWARGGLWGLSSVPKTAGEVKMEKATKLLNLFKPDDDAMAQVNDSLQYERIDEEPSGQPEGDPFADIQSNSFPEDDKENTGPNIAFDMPDLGFNDCNLGELVLQNGLYRRRSKLSLIN